MDDRRAGFVTFSKPNMLSLPYAKKLIPNPISVVYAKTKKHKNLAGILFVRFLLFIQDVV